MKRTSLIAHSLLVATALCVAGCTNSDYTEELNEGSMTLSQELLNQEPLWSYEKNSFGYLDTSSYKTEEGTTWLWHDNFGRLTSIVFFIPADNHINVLYRSPASIEQLNSRYFRLGKDNELRLYKSYEFEPQENDFCTSGMATGFDYYHQYHKGVLVYGKGYSVNYYVTPQGKRIAYASGQVLTGLSVDTTPLITADQAKQIYAARLGEEVTEDWEAELMIREYVIKDGDKDILDERLIWHVKGSAYPEKEAFWISSLSSRYVEGPLRHEAQIDAHTGRLLVEGHSLTF